MTTSAAITEADAALTVDTSGTCCPMPVIEARNAVYSLEVGQTMVLIATDPGARVDMPAWAKNTGHELLSTAMDGATYRFLIRRTR